MNTAVIALTKGGAELAGTLADKLGASAFVPARLAHGNSKGFSCGIKALTAQLFNEYDALVFIMAAGIAVRAIAPLLRGKMIDPAVVVMDERGRNAVSLLCGHMGGANELALRIAGLLGCNPVITTSSDVQGLTAVDMLAKERGYTIQNSETLTAVSAAIVNGGHVGINDSCDAAVFITHRAVPYVILRPRCVILGVGCRRGISGEQIGRAVEEFLRLTGIARESVFCVATIDIKAHEEGLIQYVEESGWELRLIPAARIAEIDSLFEGSDFVKSKVGVRCVAQPASLLAYERARPISGVFKHDGVTVAAAILSPNGNY